MKKNPLSFQIDVDKFGSASESEKRSTNFLKHYFDEMNGLLLFKINIYI